MPRASIRQLRRQWYVVFLGILTPVLLLNCIAFMQARAMTHFVTTRQRTAKPESLSLVDKMRVVLTGVKLPRPVNQRSPQDFHLTYEIHRIPITEQEFLEAWFIPAQSSQGIVLMFPPYAASKEVLLKSAVILHELGYDTLLVDFRGVGGSSGSDTTLGVREAKDVVIAFTYARSYWSDRPIILYGASMGSVAVMRAIAHEKISPTAVILESPFDRLLNTVRHRFEAMELPSFPGAELIVFWGGVQQHIDGFAHNPVEYAKAIECPTLLMYGEFDKRVTLQEVQAIFDSLSGQKQFVTFAAFGHGSLASEDAFKWRQQVKQFLR